MVNTLSYRFSHLGWSYFTLGEFRYSGANYVVPANIYLLQGEFFFFLRHPPPPPHHFQLSFMYFFKVGTHKETSPQLIPATSCGDKSHCVNGPFLLHNLATGTTFWSLRLVPQIQTELNA